MHLTDVGGAVPSSISPAFTEIIQEGLRIPPMKVIERGQYNEDFVKPLTVNSGAPEIINPVTDQPRDILNPRLQG